MAGEEVLGQATKDIAQPVLNIGAPAAESGGAGIGGALSGLFSNPASMFAGPLLNAAFGGFFGGGQKTPQTPQQIFNQWLGSIPKADLDKYGGGQIQNLFASPNDPNYRAPATPPSGYVQNPQYHDAGVQNLPLAEGQWAPQEQVRGGFQNPAPPSRLDLMGNYRYVPQNWLDKFGLQPGNVTPPTSWNHVEVSGTPGYYMPNIEQQSPGLQINGQTAMQQDQTQSSMPGGSAAAGGGGMPNINFSGSLGGGSNFGASGGMPASPGGFKMPNLPQQQQNPMSQMFSSMQMPQGFGQPGSQGPSGTGPGAGMQSPLTNVGIGAGIPNTGGQQGGLGQMGQQGMGQQGGMGGGFGGQQSFQNMFPTFRF